jgi:hypothetical protein
MYLIFTVMPVCIIYWPCCSTLFPSFFWQCSPPLTSTVGTLPKRRTHLRNVQCNAEPLRACSVEKPSKNAYVARLQRPYRSCPAATQPARQRETHLWDHLINCKDPSWCRRRVGNACKDPSRCRRRVGFPGAAAGRDRAPRMQHRESCDSPGSQCVPPHLALRTSISSNTISR